MRRYNVGVNGRSFVVDVEDSAADRFAVTVDGTTYDVALGAAEELASSPASAATPAPRIAPRAPAPTAAPRPQTAGSNGAAGLVLGAPMPGVILRLLVAAGAQVQRGQDIAVLEAMKMENIIRAPREGTIAEVCVRAGQQVAHGQAVVRFES